MQGLKFCLQWIADNDEGYETNPKVLSELPTTILVADIFGKDPLDLGKRNIMPRGGKRKNAGRHRSTSPMTRILVRMPMPLYQHLKALAAKNEVSINSAIRHILNAYVGISKA